jgi:hypothetical protein
VTSTEESVPSPVADEAIPIPSPRVMDVYRQWWVHDARWYQGVAKRFGHAAANEINAEALRYVAVQVGKRIRRQFAGRPAANVEELRRRYDACADWMFPSELRVGGTTVRMAGSLDDYDCPCTEIHAGWAEGLGVELTRNCATACLRHGDSACRLLLGTGDDPA